MSKELTNIFNNLAVQNSWISATLEDWFQRTKKRILYLVLWHI